MVSVSTDTSAIKGYMDLGVNLLHLIASFVTIAVLLSPSICNQPILYSPPYMSPRPPLPTLTLIDIKHLPQRHLLRRLRRTMHLIRLDAITLRIDLHLRPVVIKLHVLLPHLPTILHGFDAFGELVGCGHTGGDGCGGDEGYGAGGDEGGEHGAHYYGLDGGDGGVGVALRRGC